MLPLLSKLPFNTRLPPVLLTVARDAAVKLSDKVSVPPERLIGAVLLQVPVPEYAPMLAPPAETLMVPWLTRLPVYQVLAALLTFQMAPGEKVIVSSE